MQLNEESFTVAMPVEAAHRQTVKSIVGATANIPFGSAKSGPYKSVQIVLDDLRLTDVGRNGGYFYKVYVNLPQQGDAATVDANHLIGTLGPFEIASALHHGGPARLVFPITRQLAATMRDQLQDIELSIVRINGRNSPQGMTIGVGEARLEISDDEVE